MAGHFRVQDGPPTPHDAGAGVQGSYDTAGPTAGGRVDGVQEGASGPDKVHYGAGFAGFVPASPGRCARVESGGSFSKGADLATDANGRAVEATTGDTVVAVALQSASGSGQATWITFVHQREA